jgi:hypothetical protein
VSFIAYRGRFLTSTNIFPIYSPTTPIAINIKLPKNQIDSIIEAQPEIEL